MRERTRRARLVVLTGIDGSGKSTQAQRLVGELRRRGIAADYVWARWEPFLLYPFVAMAHSGSRSGSVDALRNAASEEREYRRLSGLKRVVFSSSLVRGLWLFLAVLDYAVQVHLRVRRRLHGTLQVLITDRYLPDFVADQSVNMNYAPQDIPRFMNSRLLRIFPRPDLAVFITVPPEVGHRRKSDGTALLHLAERTAFYDAIAKCTKMRVVDGTAAIAEIGDSILEHVTEVLP